jgi:hypothetical protein
MLSTDQQPGISSSKNIMAFIIIVYEVRPTKDGYGNTIGYDFHPVLRKWYLTLKEGLSAAEKCLIPT